jgi:hypothetical protein
MALPTFIVIGAVKAGTTSLHYYLSQHPEIQMSQMKEPRFFHVDGEEPDFNDLAVRYGLGLRDESEERFKIMIKSRIKRKIDNIDNYESLWDAGSEIKVRGEVSPTYIYDAIVPSRIHKRLPNIKLIAILRNPMARAYSHYIMDVRNGFEEMDDFADALRNEPFEIDDFWWGKRHYIRHGFYTRPLQRYLKEFDNVQVRIFLYDDYKNSPDEMLKNIFQFLGVDPSFKVNMSMRYNEGLIPDNSFFSDLVRSRHPVKRLLLSVVPDKLLLPIRQRIIANQKLIEPKTMTQEVRQRLIEIFREDIISVQGLLKRDLSSWLQ